MTNGTDILIIGAGAAGMMAAIFAARAGARVLLAESNEKMGKKLYITGKGRCNLTNAAEPDAFMKNIVRNPRFMYAALNAFDNRALMDMIGALGVPLKVERGGRVFPVSDHASDITRALEKEIRRLGVECRFGACVQSVDVEAGAVTGVRFKEGGRVAARRVIIATGGLSYPLTGSTGDGLRIAEQTGHRVTKPRCALVPIETVETWPRNLMGLSLKNVVLSASQGKKKLFKEQGELLFTHFGLSGPLALTLSSLLPDPCQGVALAIDLKSALDESTLDKRILRDYAAMRGRTLRSAMELLAPKSLAAQLIELLGFSPKQQVDTITQAQRRQIVALIKRLPLTVKGTRGFDEAIVTRGGVDTRDISPSTMASRKVDGLYFAGEVIDVDALTGGFNLQLAFSTGALAGNSAAQSLSGDL